jgi:hypothetical protein
LTAACLLRDERATGLLDIAWQSSDLDNDARIAVGVCLLRRGNRIGVEFLQQQLEHPKIDIRACIAPQLARVGNEAALQEMIRLAQPGTIRERDVTRFLFWGSLGIPHDLPDPEWTARVLAWVEENRAQMSR